MAGVASARCWWVFARAVRTARERPSETEVVAMSAQQLTLGLDDARTSTVAIWDSLPAETQVQVVTALAGLVARMLEGERDE
jgi:hypothetical protein